MRFELRAITPEGRIESVECQAVDEQAARAQAEGRGYTVLAVRARRDIATLWRGGERFPLPLFSQELLFLNSFCRAPTVVFRSTSVIAQQHAAQAGLGIAVLPNYMARHSVKCGMTGWAQVNGWRGNTSLRKRVQYDLYYITHWNPWFDVRIMFLTVWKGLFHRNAY